MPVKFTIYTRSTTIPEKVYKSLEALKRITEEYNIDLMRAALTRVASDNGLRCVIDPLTTSGNSFTDWIVLFDHTQVGTLTETGIGKQDNPKLCPSCGKPAGTMEGARKVDPRTNAHNVVSASIWKNVFNEVLQKPKWFGPASGQSAGVQTLVKSIEAVGSGTSRSSYNGAATQGDRRTCKTCEELQGGLSLIQRRALAKEILQETGGDPSKRNAEFDRFIGKNYGQGHQETRTEDGVATTKTHHLGFKDELMEEITRQRIEDVVRGVAIELHNRFKYMTTKSVDDPAQGGSKNVLAFKDEYKFMERFKGQDYFDFLDDIRQTAFKAATGTPLVQAEADGAKRKMMTT